MQPKEDEVAFDMKMQTVRSGIAFALTLIYPKEYEGDVEAALWAWETFGGLGARARRGFGALHHEKSEYAKLRPEMIEAQIRKGLERYVVEGPWPPDVPHLNRTLRFRIVTKAGEYDPSAAWYDLVDALQGFRQARFSKYGLSQWPEANELRRRTGKAAKLPRGVPAERLVRKFPRAYLGLPIVFHMPHDSDLPDPITLQGKKDVESGKHYERLASPLILRPIVCGAGKAVGLAAILEGIRMPPKGLELKEMPSTEPIRTKIESVLEVRKIEPLRGEPDVLQAFLNSL
jgi:CRISPR-associated protein Cmr1